MSDEKAKKPKGVKTEVVLKYRVADGKSVTTKQEKTASAGEFVDVENFHNGEEDLNALVALGVIIKTVE